MKKIIKIYKLIGILIMLLFFSACDSWKTDLEANIDQESKDYCLFDVGSYWIYQDSATLEIDSVIVAKVSYDKSTLASPTSSFLWEEYIMEIQYFLKNNIKYSGNLILTSKYCDEYKVETGINEPILLNYARGIDENKYIDTAKNSTKYHNGNLYETLGLYADGCYYENYHENLQVNSITFSKVKVFLSSLFDRSYQIRTYWAENIGIIRTEYIGKDFYAARNLIRYNVKPYNQ